MEKNIYISKCNVPVQGQKVENSRSSHTPCFLKFFHTRTHGVTEENCPIQGERKRDISGPSINHFPISDSKITDIN